MKEKSAERSGNNDRTICKKQSKPIYIQVSYLLASEETLEREFKPLTFDFFKVFFSLFL